MDVDENKIYTVEGNISGTTVLVANVGQVAQKEYSRNNRYIYIYIVTQDLIITKNFNQHLQNQVEKKR